MALARDAQGRPRDLSDPADLRSVVIDEAAGRNSVKAGEDDDLHQPDENHQSPAQRQIENNQLQ